MTKAQLEILKLMVRPLLPSKIKNYENIPSTTA
jgi:hypothetical protein